MLPFSPWLRQHGRRYCIYCPMQLCLSPPSGDPGRFKQKGLTKPNLVLNTSSLLACGGKSILSYSFLALNVPCLGEVRPSLTR